MRRLLCCLLLMFITCSCAKADTFEAFNLNGAVYLPLPTTLSITFTGTLAYDLNLGNFTAGSATVTSNMPIQDGKGNILNIPTASVFNFTFAGVTTGSDSPYVIEFVPFNSPGYALDIGLNQSSLTNFQGSAICSVANPPPPPYNPPLVGPRSPCSIFDPGIGGGLYYTIGSGSIKPASTAATPEPDTLLLMATGLVSIAALMAKRKYSTVQSRSR